MGLMIESSLLIARDREVFDLEGFLATRREPVVIASITASELLHGCHRAPEGPRKRRRIQFVEWVLSEHATIPFGLRQARCHARIWSELKRQGIMIGNFDSIIAATAVDLNYTLATWNVKEFERVPELALVELDALEPFRRR